MKCFKPRRHCNTVKNKLVKGGSFPEVIAI
jgi:hypothetical protein